MITLKNTLNAWQSKAFNKVLQDELQNVAPHRLPLQQCLTQGSHVAEDEPFTVMVINARENADQIQAKVGIFYSSVIAGCNCADDPTPVDLCNEYCELVLTINQHDAQTVISPAE
jgi:hypothetical protein